MVIDEGEQKVLLGMKKRGFGKGWWNGFGGKLQEGETMKECAFRETQEECGISMKKFEKFGHMTFEFVGDPVLLDVHIYKCTLYEGDIVESEEMRPKWFKFEDVPFDKMWPDDVLWYPFLFRNQMFEAQYLFEGHHKILKHDIKEVSGWDP